MMRSTVRTTTSLLMILACASCADYSAPSSVPNPPDTTFAEGLWTMSGSLPAILRLSSSQLQASDSVTPATSITTNSAALGGFNGIAFDAAGTMWVTSQQASALLAFKQSSLENSGVRIASTVIAAAAGSLDAPSALAFDASHNLWVANTNNGTVVRFDAAQLATSGTPTPAVILSGLGHPTGLAFDAAGGLWFSQSDAHRLAKFSAAQLDTSGFKLPAVVLTSDGPDIGNPVGLAFDAAGNLWIANSGRSNIAAILANHLTTTAFVNADIVISSNSLTPLLPLGVAFDDHQNLWVAYAEGELSRYDRAMLAASGAPAPAVRVVVSDLQLFRSIAFWPKPAGLPLN
jgi:sugar lactone lactonase YvrE